MVSSAFESMHTIHSSLSARGFFSQFVGSMIQYRHPRKPELSVGLSVDEDPWRTACKHGRFRYQLTNTTYVPDKALREEAQALLNELADEGVALHGDFDVLEFKGRIAPEAMRAMQAACQSGESMHEAFKAYLKAIHDAVKEKTENANRPGKRQEMGKQKATVQHPKKKK